MSWSMPLLVFVWLLVLLADEAHLHRTMQHNRALAAGNAQDLPGAWRRFRGFLEPEPGGNWHSRPCL